MFASRALGTTPGGHRYTSAAKFKTTRQLHHEEEGENKIKSFEKQNKILSLQTHDESLNLKIILHVRYKV